ncbi:putative ATP-dependent RNA helicase TDRD12 [Syngnathus acus]|uniref:putative ATP-dependent RNA helicase TDRD12 n=1 Tax=Syngnathus acus TaxID=161584 RepID=UPI001885DB23|nr:putative ATP-dependent RNA helicase TDRD12 [Syngnathus acus]
MTLLLYFFSSFLTKRASARPKTMSKLLNLKLVHPSCIWAQLDSHVGIDAVGKHQYDKLFASMNLFYGDYTSDQCTVTPSSLEKGQVCVVYWSQNKMWCRARLENIISESQPCLACCQLLDHGESLIVLLSRVRHVEQDFLQLPFWMRRFHLARVMPLTLQVSFCQEAKLVPSSRWDCSATSYMCDLLETSSQTEAVLLKEESNSTAIELYVSINGVKICVNDELVLKRFAIHSQDCSNSSKLEQINALLLEGLNPQPLKFPSDDEDEPVILDAPKTGGVLVHSAVPIEPCSSLADAPITESLCRILQRKQVCLSSTDLLSWPSVGRGNNTIVISHSADQPQGYLAPLLSNILLCTIFTISSSTAGPVAVVLCPGWEKVQLICDLLEECKLTQRLNATSVLLGGGKDEPKAFKMPKDCLLLVTTPFSLVRLLSCHCFLFLRLSHLVLDEADQLFTLASVQMEKILQHFKKISSRQEMSSCPQQLIAVAKRWTSHMEALIAEHMPFASVLIAAPEEAALYGNVQQRVLMTLERSKISTLLSALDFSPDVGQKTLIVCDSTEEVENVYKAVSSKSAFSLKIHEDLMHTLNCVLQQWGKEICPGAQVILVTAGECLKCLGLTDATCVVHFGFPSSPKIFGSRLSCMSHNFRNLTNLVRPGGSSGVSLLLVSEKNAQHVGGLVRYLKRSHALLPAELLSFAEAADVAREEQKTERPLCHHLKSFGMCRFGAVCPDRHRLIPQLDQSELPASGLIEVLPLHIKTASVFYGRIIQREKEVFDRMVAGMTSYYADSKPCPEEVLEGGLYAVQDDHHFHRVKVLTVADNKGRLFFSVLARFIDIGKEAEVKSHQILRLPEEFHSLPGQAVEMIVCQVKPCDAEANWHPKVTRTISQKIQGVQHRARAVLSLGNTVFLDLMVLESRVAGMKTVISEYNVPSLILNTGMAERNPDHVNLLKLLSGTSATNHACGNQTSEPPVKSLDMSNNKDGVFAGDNQKNNQLSHGEAHMTKSVSLHPQVRWYQTSTELSVTLKLRDPQSQRCEFHTDRVVYSCIVNGRRYGVDFELHSAVSAERCHRKLNCNEPVLTLVKQEPGYWPTLLRSKNIFVSYDMEHLEQEDIVSRQSHVFESDTGEEHRFVNRHSSSDSDSC